MQWANRYASTVRVVAGTARGLAIVAPKGTATRPTSDRTREAMFSILTSMGAIEEAVMVDLFAGSGALGVEALSRGAERVWFVDNAADAIASIRDNLERTHTADRATVVRGDALAWIRAHGHEVDVVLADPPYTFDAWAELLAAVPNALVMAESNRIIATPEGWEAVRERRYGTTVVMVFARPSDNETTT